MASRLLSKTKYLSGLQCQKYLWVATHEPNRIPEPDAGTQHRFDQGHLVGQLAKNLFPDGIDIPVGNFIGNIKQTSELLSKRRPLFEAGILRDNLYCRVDILHPSGSDAWDIVEVKSSTKIRMVDLHDVSFQRLCCEMSGLKVNKCYLTHINNQYVKVDEIDCHQLFITEDITEKVDEARSSISGRVEDLLEVVSAERCPEVDIGRQCTDPYGCPLERECWGFPTENSVFDLYRGGASSIELYESGVFAIKDIPKHFRLTDKQRIQKECIATGMPFVDGDAIRGFLETLQPPLWFLDFETFSPAVPMFDGTRPYQRIPFQFSLHVMKEGETEPEHYSFLAEGTDDPRLELLAELRKVLGDKGSIIAYNAVFEKSLLTELGETFFEHRRWVETLQSRFVDLLSPFRNFLYHHPYQKGSASMKNVLPALTGKSYKGMAIADGEKASIAFVDVTYRDASVEERARVRKSLEDYCGLDTQGMVWIVEQLREEA